MSKEDEVKGNGLVKKNANQKRIEAGEEELKKLEEEAAKAKNTSENSDEEEEKGKEPTSSEEKNWKKRYGDLRRHLDEEKKKAQEQINSLEEQLKRKETFKPPASEEDIEEWKKKFPEGTKIIEALATKIAEKKFQDAKLSLDELRESQVDTAKEKALSKIKAKHPDFDELTEDDSFHDWLESKPKYVQDAFYENSTDADSAISFLDWYKNENPKKKKRDEEEAASEVRARAKQDVDENSMKGSLRESEVAKWSPKEFAKREHEVDEAVASGKFIYDLSGAAR